MPQQSGCRAAMVMARSLQLPRYMISTWLSGRRSLQSLTAAAALAVACGYSVPEPAAPLSSPKELCAGSGATSDCLRVEQVEGWLEHPEMKLLGRSDTPTGIQGAKVVTLSVPTDHGHHVFRAKWRPHSALSTASYPRRELVAYRVQKLFLEPEEYVVPPTRAHCFDLDDYRQHFGGEAQATFPQFDCVFGYLSYWLEDVRPVHGIEWLKPERGVYDPEHFESDRRYRQAMSNVNLLMYLIDHDDSHDAQFLIKDDPQRPLVYSVDNSMAFHAGTNPKLDEDDDWSNIQVPIESETLRRLTSVSRRQLADLSKVQVLAIDEDGLAPTDDPGLEVGPGRPLRKVGQHVVVGLSHPEIEFLHTRIVRLQAKRDEGEFREL